MPSLREVQTAFGDAVINGNDAVTPEILGDGLDAAERIAIHRNNTFITLTDSLAATYPVVRKLVGEAFFSAAMREFIKVHPPRQRTAAEYGYTLADFLEQFDRVRELPYLADVARLEWARHEAYHGPDAEPLGPRDFNAFSPEEYADLYFLLHPTLRMMESPYPVRSIWNANQAQPDDVAPVTLDDGGDALLVIRPHMDVEMHAVSPGMPALLDTLDEGANLEAALNKALDVEPGLYLERTLADFIAWGAFSRVSRRRLHLS